MEEERFPPAPTLVPCDRNKKDYTWTGMGGGGALTY